MGKEKVGNIRLGLFVIAAFAIFVIAIYNIGSRQNRFGSNIIISSIFENVNGLKPGNNVRYSGINVGSVDDIIILNDSTIQVDMRIETKVQPFLKKDALSSIATDGLVGNMIVNISPGKGNEPAVEDGDLLKSYSRIEAEDMMNTLGKTTENVALLTLNLLEIVENINKGTGSFSMLINDDQLAKDLQLSVQNLKNTTRNLQTMTGQLQSNIADINEGKGLIGYLLKDSTFEGKINKITYDLDEVLIKRTAPIMDNLELTSQQIVSASSNINAIIDKIDLDQGLAGTILKDTTLSVDLKQIMQNLNEGTDRFNQNMEALKGNFLFKKYFKKLEKEKQKEDLEASANRE